MAPRSERDTGQQGSEDRRVQDLAAAACRAHHPDSAEHRQLLKAAANGDVKARDELTQAHLDWVLSAARERADRGLSQGDLFQEGSIGLMEAIDRFPSSGWVDFEGFAREQVARRMDGALGEEERVVNDGRMLIQAAEEYEAAEISLRLELGRGATDSELAGKLQWSVQRTEEIGQMVADARRRHDEELLEYLDPVDANLETPVEDKQTGDAR